MADRPPPPPGRQPHPLAGLGKLRYQLREESNAQFEYEVTRYVAINVLGPWAVKRVRQQLEESTGDEGLTLPALCRELLPEYCLESLVIRDVDKMVKVSKLLADFGNTKLVQKWLELYAERPRSMRSRFFGLIVRWPYLPPGLILHNAARGDRQEGSCFVWRKEHLVLTLESLKQWAESYKRNRG